LKNSIAAQDLDNIQILPAVSQEEYLSMISEFDVGLISLDARFTTHNIPGKLLSYLYWGLPVLGSVNPGNDLFDLLNKNQAGVCLVNGDEDNLIAAAQRLADNPDLRSEMGRNARRLLEQTFSVQLAANQIMEHLRDAGFVFPRASAATPIPTKHRDQETAFVEQS